MQFECYLRDYIAGLLLCQEIAFFQLLPSGTPQGTGAGWQQSQS